MKLKETLVESNVGCITKEGRASINWSSIATILIKEAGKCASYSSDIFYDLKSVEETLNECKDNSFMFGFRDMGVDHKDFVSIRLEDQLKMTNVYRKLYKLSITFDKEFNSVNMLLMELSDVQKTTKRNKYRIDLCNIGRQLCILSDEDVAYILDDENTDFEAERRLRTVRKQSCYC